MTRIYLDTEFIDNGFDIKLISIGFVDERGKELYLINSDTEVLGKMMAVPWLRRNVAPYLPIKESKNRVPIWDPDHADARLLANRREMREKILKYFMDRPKPELWAWYAAYDHVALCQIFGPMVNLPSAIPQHTGDLRQEHVRLGEPLLPRQVGPKHHALADAHHDWEVGKHLAQIDMAREIKIFQDGQRNAEDHL